MQTHIHVRSRIVFAAATLLVIVLASCSGDDSSTPEISANPLQNASLSVDSVTGLGRVDINGVTVTKAVEDLTVVIGAQGTDDIVLPVEAGGDGLFFYAPLHPTAPNMGGTVTVHLTSGEHRSEDIPLELGALPPAPGAFLRVVETLRAHIDQRAVFSGTSFDELAATPFDQVSPELLPLKTAQSFVDNGTETDFTSLAGPGGGHMSEDERELIDRIFGFAPLDSLLQAQIDAFAEETAGKTANLPKRVGRTMATDCIDLGLDFSTAESLSEAMIYSALANIAIDPDGAPGRTLEALGVVLSAGGVIPGSGTVFSVAGAGLAIWQAANAMLGNIWPNRFVELEFEIDKTEFPEDHDGYATWSDVMAKAASTEWTADGDIANVVISALGTKISLTQKLKIQEAEFLRDAAITTLNETLGAFLDEQPSGIIRICGDDWTVDISDLPYSTGQVLDHNFTVDPAWRRVSLLEVGPDILRVAAQPSQFGGREISKDLPIETKPIILDLTPDDITLEIPDGTISVTSSIFNAEVETMLWTAQEGTWNDGLDDETNGPRTRTLAVPNDPAVYPFLITVESTSTGGLRADGEPIRVDIATVRLVGTDIVITPNHECVDNNETIQFTAQVFGVDDPEVLWGIESGYGSINETTGLYTSPPIGVSDDVIVATVVDHEDLIDKATVRVGACECHFMIDVFGDSFWSVAGSDGYYTALVIDTASVIQWQFILPGDDDDLAGFSASLWGDETNPGPQPGDTGTWRINAVYINSSATETWNMTQEDEDAQMVVNITEFTSTHMTGTMSGQCVQRADPENSDLITSSVAVSVDFTIGYWEIGLPFPCQN